MKRLLAYLFIVLGLGLVVNGFALADLTFVSWGGAFTASQQKAYIDTWSKGSRVTVENYNGGLGEIKAQVNSGNVNWDVVDILPDQAIVGCDEGLFEKIPQDREMINDMIVSPISDCVVPQIFWSYVVFFDKNIFPGKKPKKIKDFFDVKKFPGKRGVHTWANGLVEMALVADGVKPSKVYEVLSTSEGVERAFRQLDKIRDHVVFWSAGAQPLNLVASGEVVMSIAYNGRVGAAILQEGRDNFEYLWDGQVLEQEYLAMLKGTKNKREALEFMKHASSAKSLALQAKYIPYGPMRKSSIDIIKRGEPWFNTGANITKHINSRPKLLKRSVLADPFWWADNGYNINEIFSNWKDGGSYGFAQKTIAKQISKPSKNLVTKVFEKPDEEKKIVSKKSKIKTIDQMYADGYLSKDECLKVKRKVLGDGSQVSCGETEIKVAKKKKKKQKEWTPTKVDEDTDPPVLKIADIVTVNNPDYTLDLEVSDKGSKKLYVEVDDIVSRVTDKKGKFKVKRYSPVDEEVKITAIDQWGNKTSKTVKVKVVTNTTQIVKKLEPLNPLSIKGQNKGDKIALIIGIEKYTDTVKANYANLDAKYFNEYAREVFNVKSENINLLIDSEATLTKINKGLFKWLAGKIKPDQTEVIIFFAGHGLASNDGKELYILPQDGDPDLLKRTSISRSELLKEIINLKPKSVTMFLDMCYSGVSRDEETLLASARPVRIVAEEQGDIPDNFTIFTASKLDQISSGLKEAKHGIFSYYLMKGLEGKADSNEDKKITNGELLAYLDENVSQKALELGRQQNPSLAGNPDQVLMRYR
jgi:putative spermidine/putrescine transport system substrate-binding protein